MYICVSDAIKFIHCIFIDTTVKFTQSTYRVNEDDGSVQPALVLSQPVSASITVTVFSSDGSAEGIAYIYVHIYHSVCVYVRMYM